MKLYKFFSVLIIILALQKPVFCEVFEVDAVKNSVLHNNLGMNHFNEGYYFGAIQEFKIAISLNPNTQASANYFDNLGRTYLAIGYPELSEDCFLNAIKLNPMNLSYRQHLADAYRRMGKSMVNAKLDYYLKSTNPLDSVMAGLLYIQKGDVQAGIIKLDEFYIMNSNLILAQGVKTYLKALSSQNEEDL